MYNEYYEQLNTLEEDYLVEMANLSPKRTGLSVTIWSDNNGINRNVAHNEPRVKIGKNNYWVVVTIASDPVIKAQSANIKKWEMEQIMLGIEYVSRNYDLFLKHFISSNEEFDDQDLMDALRQRGEYK